MCLFHCPVSQSPLCFFQLFPCLYPCPSLPHVMFSVEKLMMVGMKLSLNRTPLMDFQSVADSPISRQMDSMAMFTVLGGLPRARNSTRCCLLMDFTANREEGGRGCGNANSVCTVGANYKVCFWLWCAAGTGAVEVQW